VWPQLHQIVGTANSTEFYTGCERTESPHSSACWSQCLQTLFNSSLDTAGDCGSHVILQTWAGGPANMPGWSSQRWASKPSDTTQQFTCLCEGESCGYHMILAKDPLTHLTDKQGGRPWKLKSQPQALCFVSAMLLRQWDSFLTRKDGASNHYILLLLKFPHPPLLSLLWRTISDPLPLHFSHDSDHLPTQTPRQWRTDCRRSQKVRVV
jgi:hypothetical protein